VRSRPSFRCLDKLSKARIDCCYLGSNPPFGFLVGDGGRLVADPKKQRLVSLMRKRRSQGVSLRTIAAEMLEKGFKISHSGVAAALKSASSEVDQEDR